MVSEMCIIKYMTYRINDTKFDILDININYPTKNAKYANYK